MDIKFKFKSLKTKILFYFSCIVILLLLTFSFAFYYYFNQTVTNSIKTNLAKIAYEIEEDFETNQTLNIVNKFNNFDIAILKNNKIIIKNSNFNFLDFNFNKEFFIKDYGEFLNAGLVLKFETPFNGKIIVIQKNIDDKSESVVDVMLILEPILLLLLIFLASKMIDKILEPIKKITETSKQISINNFRNTIPQSEEYELKELIDSFNDMVKRLQKEVENLDRFNTNVSHELKIPITIIKGEISIALKKQRDLDYYKKSIETILEEINNIESITNNLLFLTKYTKENIKETFVLCDLDLILLEVVEKYNYLLNEKNINMEFKKFENIKYNGNSQFLYHIFSNLIDNSVKYSDNDSTIFISLYRKDKIYFIIQDEGIGIPKEEIPKITEQFYRIDKSRNKDIAGFGLGLSIVKYGLELHNGFFKIDSTPKGTKIEIVF